MRKPPEQSGAVHEFQEYATFKPLQDDKRFKTLVETTFHQSLLPGWEEKISTGNNSSVSENGYKIDYSGEDTKSLMDENEIVRTLSYLEQLMNREKKFLDTTTTLRNLAGELKVHPNKLSWLLNDRLGMNSMTTSTAFG